MGQRFHTGTERREAPRAVVASAVDCHESRLGTRLFQRLSKRLALGDRGCIVLVAVHDEERERVFRDVGWSVVGEPDTPVTIGTHAPIWTKSVWLSMAVSRTRPVVSMFAGLSTNRNGRAAAPGDFPSGLGFSVALTAPTGASPISISSRMIPLG
jgi:hypothetical protein